MIPFSGLAVHRRSTPWAVRGAAVRPDTFDGLDASSMIVATFARVVSVTSSWLIVSSMEARV